MTPLRAGQGGAAQAAQAAAWQRYLAWERSNVQHLDGPALAARVVLAYDQALGPLVHFLEARLMRRAQSTCSEAEEALWSRATAAFTCLTSLLACFTSHIARRAGFSMAAILSALVQKRCATLS